MALHQECRVLCTLGQAEELLHFFFRGLDRLPPREWSVRDIRHVLTLEAAALNHSPNNVPNHICPKVYANCYISMQSRLEQASLFSESFDTPISHKTKSLFY